MKNVGYARVEPGDDLDELESRLHDHGCEMIYSEKHRGVSRKSKKQSFGHAVRAVHAGDRFVIDKRERIGRDDREADALLAGLLKKGVHVVILDEDVDTQNDEGAFEKELVAKLAEAGISNDHIEATMSDAEKEGEKTLRFKIRPEHYTDITQRFARGETTKEIAKAYGANETAVRRAKRRIGLGPQRRSRL